MRHEDILTNARFAGEVKRYHTFPVLRPQSVAEHTWQIMRIWYQIWGSMPPHISSKILWHDCGELVVGDLPYTGKVMLSPELRAELANIEEDAMFNMGGPAHLLLTENETLRVKLCDVLEMCEFGFEEMMFGNNFGYPIYKVTFDHVQSLMQRLGDDDINRVMGYLDRMLKTHAAQVMRAPPEQPRAEARPRYQDNKPPHRFRKA